MLYIALIRTHHITSRKKVATLKTAAKRLGCYALLRSGGVPGVMFVQGDGKDTVQAWVDVVHGLRYKDYQLAAPPVAAKTVVRQEPRLEEVETVKEMGAILEGAGLREWWRKAMGFSQG